MSSSSGEESWPSVFCVAPCCPHDQQTVYINNKCEMDDATVVEINFLDVEFAVPESET